MNPARWARVKEVFFEALEREPDRRSRFLRDACAGDASLRATVEAMLAREPEARGFLESRAIRIQAGSHRPSTARAGPPWWLYLLAAAFLGDCLLRTWCRDFGPEGFGFAARREAGRLVVATVHADGLAEGAGMRAGDVVVALDGRPADRVFDPRVIYPNLEVGRAYRLDVERSGRPVPLTIVMRRVRVLSSPYFQVRLLWQLADLATLATALLIAFKRPRDRVALAGALALATLSVGLYLFHLPPGYAIAWRGALLGLGGLLWIPNLCVSQIGPIGLTFFTLFPRPLFRRRWPWALVWLPTLCLLPIDVSSIFWTVYHPDEAYGRVAPGWVRQGQVALFGAYGLAMLGAVVANYLRLSDANERRRLRVLVAGGAIGTLPALLRLLVMGLAGQSVLRRWLDSPVPDVLIAVLFLLFPASFAYAILRHRLLDVRVIVRLGVRYALAHGLVISVVPGLGLLLLVDVVAHGDRPLLEILRARGWVYGALGAGALLVYSQRRRWSSAVDRRFFREEYDVRRLLRAVADAAREAKSVEGAAPAVAAHVEAALHPEFAAVLVMRPGERSFRAVASSPVGQAPPPLAADGGLAEWVRAQSAEAVSLSSAPLQERLSADETDLVQSARIELLVPIQVTAPPPQAMLALGPKRSEQPYTQEDRELLGAIASSLALLLGGPGPAATSGGFEECPACGTCYDTGTGRCASDPAPLVPVPMPRALAGRYRLERRLGSGGMGKVYEAVDDALARRVAVKVLRDDWVRSDSAVRRFEREARALAGFAHPNVVGLYDYGVGEGAPPFLVMELLLGVTLREELRKAGRLIPGRAVEVLRGVCGAVEAAHRHHIVHRDLKPENIFLAVGDDGRTVRILDFGVAKLLDAGEDGGGREGDYETEAGVLVGTVGYMSPEQLLGGRPALSWDLWALSVVAYESVTGALPFPVGSRESWRQAVLSGQYTPLGRHLPDPPTRWIAFFDRCFAADAGRRPAAASELLQDLERAIAS
jgi:tRNA A-37 threonylcarbamoyl transferase component Bud32